MRTALETAIKLEPKHADAHIGLRHFQCRSHREGRQHDWREMTYGASKEGAVELRKARSSSTPDSVIARTGMADGLYKPFGDKKMKDVEGKWRRRSLARCDGTSRWGGG